jgi:hypothetical protein
VRTLLESDQPLAGSKRFIVSANWWRKWCDYVNFSKDSVILDESFTNISFYEKPSLIENRYLLDSGMRLQNAIVEHFDYTVVSLEVWKHLEAWYQCDFRICRRLIVDEQNHLRLDLYPEHGALSNRVNTMPRYRETLRSQSSSVSSGLSDL